MGFFEGFEKRARGPIKIEDNDVWKAKWHPQGAEREHVKNMIHQKLKSNKNRLSPEGMEELEQHENGHASDDTAIWHPRFLK